MNMSKKKVIYIIGSIIGVVLLVGVGFIAVSLYKTHNTQDGNGAQQSDNKKIDSLIRESDDLMAKGDKDGAVERLEEAQELAKESGDKDKQWDIEVRIDYTKNTDVPALDTQKGDYAPVATDPSQQGAKTDTETQIRKE
jgi:hypothetical protein